MMNSYLFTFVWLVLVWCRAAVRRALFGGKAATHRLDQLLRLQASLDGELSGRETQRMADVLARDPEAQPLLTELGLIKSALAGNEPERPVPQSRDFYWGRITQAIAQQAEAERRRRERTCKRVWRLAPATGFALGILTRKEAEAALAEKRLPRLEPARTCLPGQTIRQLAVLLIESTTHLVVLADADGQNVLGLVTLHDCREPAGWDFPRPSQVEKLLGGLPAGGQYHPRPKSQAASEQRARS
jgi:hypothetical protein